MAFGPLIFGLVSTFCLAAILLCRYVNPARHHVAVTGSVFLAWYFSMLIIILMPLDVSTTAFNQCLAYNNLSRKSTRPPFAPIALSLESLRAYSGPHEVVLFNENSTESLTEFSTESSYRSSSRSPSRSSSGNFSSGNLSVNSSSSLSVNSSNSLSRNSSNSLSGNSSNSLFGNLSSSTVSAALTEIIRSTESTVSSNRTSSTTSTASPAHGTVTDLPPVTSSISPRPSIDPCVMPWSHVPGNAFPVLWRIVYWSSQMLTWIILPLMQSYSTAGDFTTSGKLKTALYENAVYYGTYLCILVVLLIYLVLHGIGLDAGKLKVVCITASNTWGLFLLVLLLGSGLVELPRSLWNLSRKGYRLRYLYFKAAKLSMEKCEAEEQLDDALKELRQVNNCITGGSPSRHYVDVIISKIPRDKWEDQRKNRTTASGASVSEKSLVRLHKQVIKAMHGVTRTQVQWDTLLRDILYWEDISKNETSADRKFKSSLEYRSRGQLTRMLCTPSVEWYWRCMLRSLFVRLLAGLFAVFSVLLIFSEVTFFIRQPIISIVGVIHRSLEASHNYLGLELLCVLSLGYLCLCTYFTVFKIRIFNLYYLVPNQQTSEYSLIFSGMMLCRLTPPLCLNFLGMIHLDQHISQERNRVETAYTHIMGHMDVISIVSDGFNVYFPMLICVLGVATYLKWGSKVLHALGFEQFLTDDDLTTDLVDEGRDLVKRDKNRRQRQEENELRRRQRLQAASSQEYNSTTSRNRHILGSNGSTESARAELLSGVGDTPDYSSRDFSASDNWSGNRPPSNLFDDV